MDRTELRVALDKLNERQNKENRVNADNYLAIQKKRNDIVRSADDALQTEKMQENIRHKEVMAAIEYERQQLFADYKMSKSEK